MLALNGAVLLGAALLLGGEHGGYCVYGIATFAQYAAYPPLLYATFLADFFSEEDDLDADGPYYSEMHDAGFFLDGLAEGEGDGF